MKNEQQIFGIRSIIEAIEAGTEIDKVFIQKGIQGDLMKQLLYRIKQNNINFSYVPVEKLNKFSNRNHQGAVATISPVTFYNLEKIITALEAGNKKALFLILDGVSDTRNFGAIIRTAECTGVDAIIIPKQGAAPVNADTVKTSAGAIFNIPICKVDHIKDALFLLQAYNITTIAATEKTTTHLYTVDFSESVAIIMGNEAKGVSQSILKNVDKKAQLPMLGTISSLNVSVACGAFLYECVRQRM